jgi:hypothetical protein
MSLRLFLWFQEISRAFGNTHPVTTSALQSFISATLHEVSFSTSGDFGHCQITRQIHGAMRLRQQILCLQSLGAQEPGRKILCVFLRPEIAMRAYSNWFLVLKCFGVVDGVASGCMFAILNHKHSVHVRLKI